MLESIWLALFAFAAVTTLVMFVLERTSVLLSLVTAGTWIAVAFGAQGITVYSGGTASTTVETPATAFAVGMALYSVLLFVIALGGGTDSDDTPATGELRQRVADELET